MVPISRKVRGIALLLIAGVSLSACATKEYVNKQVGALEARHGTRLDDLDRTSRDALERATAAGKLAEGKFVYNVVLSDEATKFALGKSDLSDEAKSQLTALAERLKSENKNVYLEIQGHTDSTGDALYNDAIGLKRAEAVRLFLNRSGVPLNRMASISYGEDAPVADNANREGRAQNRRVVIVVLN